MVHVHSLLSQTCQGVLQWVRSAACRLESWPTRVNSPWDPGNHIHVLSHCPDIVPCSLIQLVSSLFLSVCLVPYRHTRSEREGGQEHASRCLLHGRPQMLVTNYFSRYTKCCLEVAMHTLQTSMQNQNVRTLHPLVHSRLYQFLIHFCLPSH